MKCWVNYKGAEEQLHSEEAWQNHHLNQGTEPDIPSDATK